MSTSVMHWRPLVTSLVCALCVGSADAVRAGSDDDGSDNVSIASDDPPLRCHDTDDLALYLIKSNSNESKPRMYSCGYDYAPRSYNAHAFVSLGLEAINCADLPPYSTATADRWHNSGCTPFRRVAAIAARVQACVRRAAQSFMPEFEDVMQRSSKYFWEADATEAHAKLRNFLRRKAKEMLIEFGRNETAADDSFPTWWSENGAPDADAILKCFEEEGKHVSPRVTQPDTELPKPDLSPVQRAMRCLPALWGRVGFGVGGLRNEGLVYRANGDQVVVESTRFNCQKSSGKPCEEKCAKGTSPRPLACPRLSVASLAHFSPKRYEQNLPVLRWASTWLQRTTGWGSSGTDWCKRQDASSAANCWLFTQCAEAELDDVCKMVPECCAKSGLEAVPVAEQQVLLTTDGEEQQGAENTAAWAVGAKELASRQKLFGEFGCKKDCATIS